MVQLVLRIVDDLSKPLTLKFLALFKQYMQAATSGLSHCLKTSTIQKSYMFAADIN
jgi:hypothetical protein